MIDRSEKFPPVPSGDDSTDRQWPFAVAELLLGKALGLLEVHMHRRDKAPVEEADGKDLALREWRSWLVGESILGLDTAPGGIVMEDTVEEGGTAMARTVPEEDIGRHGPDRVAEGRKSADTMELSATVATAKFTAVYTVILGSTYWVGSLLFRIIPMRASCVSGIRAIWITLTARVVIIGIARHLCGWERE